MVRTGFGVRGVAPGVSVALMYLAALSTLSCGHAFVVSPSASRACSGAARGSWRGSSSSSSRPRVGAGSVRARKLRGLEVAAGENTVESSSVAEGDAMRVGQIEAFADKVMEGMAADGMDSSFMSIFGEFLGGYSKCAIKAGTTPEQFQFNLGTLIKMVPENMKKPYEFELFHESTRDPMDLYTWGNDFFRPLIELDNSRLEGKENLEKIAEYLAKGENVFLMSNHQTEADPQVISLLMEREGYGDEASRLINVAGHRVTTDPLAIPFSMGRNLFCIFSKKYMETPPELKGEKQKHNVRTLKKMAEMMSEGGQFIWVAPSGGRDRPDPDTGKFVVSPYDPKSVEVFRLMAAKAMGRNKTGPATHFFPFAMWTNKLVPPPDQVNKELGERRQADRGPASVAFGEEVLPPPGETLKKAEFIAIMEERVQAEYAKLDEFHESKQK
ncbi:unnamed protein product [Ectocarpus sp. 6 AP-2014]